MVKSKRYLFLWPARDVLGEKIFIEVGFNEFLETRYDLLGW